MHRAFSRRKLCEQRRWWKSDILHRPQGILMQTKKDVGLDFGVGPEDTLLQYTTV